MPVFNAIPSGPLPVAQQIKDRLPQFKLDHVSRLTDDVGILQHAIYTISNRVEGYATDDNARALILTVLLEQPEIGAVTNIEWGQSDWPYRYLALLEHAFNRENQRFRNFLGYDRRWMEEHGGAGIRGLPWPRIVGTWHTAGQLRQPWAQRSRPAVIRVIRAGSAGLL